MIGTNSMEDIIMKMKKITYALLAIAFIAAFNSCKEEEEIQTPDEDNWEYFMKQYDENTPHTPGTFVMFGANTFYKNGEETRTQYSGKEIEIGSNKYERIDWIDGDKLQIYCNQSSSGVYNAVYAINESTIAVNQDDKRQSVAAVTLDSEQGLKWSETDPHIFTGLYPAEKTFGKNAGEKSYPKVTESTGDFKFITCVPEQQPYPVDMNLAGMVARTTASLDQRGNVSMVYYPIVTTLQFDLLNVSKNDITIKKIYIDGENVDLAGTNNVTIPSDLQTISNPASELTFNCDRQGQISVININEFLEAKSTKTVRVVMFALPVEFTGAKLAIVMDINGSEVTRKVALNYKETVNGETVKKDIVFQPTHKYNFTIKIPDSIVFEVTPDSYDYDVPGGAAPLNVTSYTYNAAGEKTPVAWTATRYSLDGGETWLPFGPAVLNPDAIGVLPTMLEGWDLFNTIDVPAADRQIVTPVNGTVSYNKPPYRKLKEAEPAVDVDLSMRDVNGNPTATRNTANCYMVHARGTYKFPMVYGNAIKNGAINTIAFNPTMDRTTQEIADSIAYVPAEGVINKGWGGVDRVTSHFLSPFVNHSGNGITDPWLKNNGANATQAQLIWQDAKGLITSVGIDGDYVTFTVTDEMSDLVEGNALIAVTDGTDILWSWHIWITEITDEDSINAPGDAFQHVYEGQTQASTIIGKKLVDNAIPGVTGAKIGAFVGFCDLSVGPRKIEIEFKQEETNETRTVTLTQKGKFDGNAPIYQYGRKDPLQCHENLYELRAIDKPFYDNENNPVSMAIDKTGFGSGATMVANGIKRPNTFCANSVMDDKYFNLWAARLTRIGRYDALRADKTKTIYDPCPAGYRVPALADVAGWAGDNSGRQYYEGRVNTSNTAYNYVVLTIEPNGVYVPIIAGKLLNTGKYGGWSNYGHTSAWNKPDRYVWWMWETASWVSTPSAFSIVWTEFTDENGITHKKNEHNAYSEDFYWRYSDKCHTRWQVGSGECYQIRFHNQLIWMNEDGGSRANAAGTFMVKETAYDTCTDDYTSNN